MTVDELGDFGLVHMTDDEIRGFLANQRVCVLGLPTDGAPFLRPMSFGFDGDRSLYLVYVVGQTTRKRDLTEAAGAARVLVFDASTAFQWQSVLCTGTIEAVPGDALPQDVDVAWRPDLFERAAESLDTAVYRVDVTEWTGVKHLGLPPGIDPDGTTAD
jgi:nitroimidazol reductase NimA-like FMN-containing flavoprotein (pyridoxamine 5'-phosphate oxidase superfamily)